MASSSGNSSQILRNSSSEEDLRDERKRKRMESNRESARRSRMRKQKHLDDLTAQIADLRRENGQILNTVSITTQRFMNVEAENAVLRAQMAELSNRLDSLNEILSYIGAGDGGGGAATMEMVGGDGLMMGNHWNLGYVNQQPIMASVDYHDFGH